MLLVHRGLRRMVISPVQQQPRPLCRVMCALPACQALPSRVCRASLSSRVRQPFCPKRGASATMRASRRSRHLWLQRSIVLQGNNVFDKYIYKVRSACQAVRQTGADGSLAWLHQPRAAQRKHCH